MEETMKAQCSIYNLAATENSKMKMFTQDESREKQRSPAKTTLIAPELAQKGSRRGTAPNTTQCKSDIAYSVRVVSQYSSNLNKEHKQAVLQIFHYLKGTVD